MSVYLLGCWFILFVVRLRWLWLLYLMGFEFVFCLLDDGVFALLGLFCYSSADLFWWVLVGWLVLCCLLIVLVWALL